MAARHWHRHFKLVQLLGGDNSAKRFRWMMRTDGINMHVVYTTARVMEAAEKKAERATKGTLRAVSCCWLLLVGGWLWHAFHPAVIHTPGMYTACAGR
jgi:hypothetical protein